MKSRTLLPKNPLAAKRVTYGFCNVFARADLWSHVEQSQRITKAVNEATKIFRQSGVSEPELSAEYLATATFKRVRHRNEINSSDDDHELNCSTGRRELQKYIELCRQRQELKTPIQYLVGDWDFHYITLKVKPPVLIPRPETEQLVEFVLDEQRKQQTKSNGSDNRPRQVLDIGCGSGAIICSVLKALKDTKGWAIDISDKAVELTEENRDALQLQDELTVEHISDLNDFVRDHSNLEGQFDVIVSNPPYIPSGDMSGLQEEVKDHEDRRALDGGSDGLEIIEEILAIAPFLLRRGGSLWMEVDSSHPKVLCDRTFEELEFIQYEKDCYGNDRFVQWRRV